MGVAERQQQILELEKLRGSKVVTYVTQTRDGVNSQMGMDAVRRIYEHIRSSHWKQIDLFIHSNGGEGTVPWRLVNLLREYTDRLAVLVPHNAFSAATLTALGADEIVMHPMGVLGPTDPTVTGPYNPKDPNGQPLGISVEDFSAYLSIAADDLNLSQDGQKETLSLISAQVHPLALGNAKRIQSQSRMIARKLLSLHMNPDTDRGRMDAIIEALTSKLYFHGHPINRVEAQELGLRVLPDADEKVLDAMWSLFCDFEAEMELDRAFRPVDTFLAANPTLAPGTLGTHPMTIQGVRVESEGMVHMHSTDFRLTGMVQPDGNCQVNMPVVREGWTFQTV